MAAAIGIDCGGSRMKAAIIGENGDIIHKSIAQTDAGREYEGLLEQITAVIGDFIKSSVDEMVGVGIGIAGLVSGDRMRIVASPNMPFLAGKTLGDDLAKALDLPVIMDNDANLMALGEGLWGAAKGCSHYIAVTVGTGVGGAVISGGKLIRGTGGGGGELGHVSIDINGARCGCGGAGCLEAYIGAAGVRRHIAAVHPQMIGLPMHELNRRANMGDEDAAEVFDYIGTTLGAALAGLVNVFNPELIVIGGGVAEAGRMVLRPVENEIRARAFECYAQSVRVVQVKLGSWSAAVGAGMEAWRVNA